MFRHIFFTFPGTFFHISHFLVCWIYIFGTCLAHFELILDSESYIGYGRHKTGGGAGSAKCHGAQGESKEPCAFEATGWLDFPAHRRAARADCEVRGGPSDVRGGGRKGVPWRARAGHHRQWHAGPPEEPNSAQAPPTRRSGNGSCNMKI